MGISDVVLSYTLAANALVDWNNRYGTDLDKCVLFEHGS
jgi:hypothetical protein